ncbi:glutathione S-transferase kappa 1 isoform X1 [Danio rerio]|uniref:Glutathione S-transferase kappa 1 n=6 Tax=Danio rerio TaxID=7955 RepID=A0AB32T2G0_DANRE
MSGSRKVVELFYDVVSPYSWLAFEVLCRYRNVWNIDLKLKPAFLGAVMHDSGNRPPGMIPNKFLYMTSDLKHVSEYFGVPVRQPSNVFETMFEKGSLKAMRFVTAVAEKEKEGDVKLERVSRELWNRIWSNDQDITLPASFAEAGLKAGLTASEVDELLTLATSQAIKDNQRSEAIKYKMISSGKVIKLFYDISSPYSWLAFEVLCRYKNIWNVELKLKPAYLAGVMYGSGNQPPVLNPSKLLYMTSDLTLLSQYFGVPMYRPSKLIKKDSVIPMRFVTAVAEKEKDGDDLVEKVSRELWKRMWSTHQDIVQPASLTEVGIKAGFSANEVDDILILAKSQQIKDRLTSITNEALKYKCFGLPFIVVQVDGKAGVFFGSDRFELMAYFLGEKWFGPHPT